MRRRNENYCRFVNHWSSYLSSSQAASTTTESVVLVPDLSTSLSVPGETAGTGGGSWLEYLGAGSGICAGIGAVCALSWLGGRWCR